MWNKIARYMKQYACTSRSFHPSMIDMARTRRDIYSLVTRNNAVHHDACVRICRRDLKNLVYFVINSSQAESSEQAKMYICMNGAMWFVPPAGPKGRSGGEMQRCTLLVQRSFLNLQISARISAPRDARGDPAVQTGCNTYFVGGQRSYDRDRTWVTSLI